VTHCSNLTSFAIVDGKGVKNQDLERFQAEHVPPAHLYLYLYSLNPLSLVRTLENVTGRDARRKTSAGSSENS
jgi:hypothetical protein